MSAASSAPHPWLSPRNLLWASIAVAVVTIALKTLAWVVTGSVGLLSDAMESFVNLASAMFALAMVTVAQRPADDDHPYGHHKAEYFSSGFEGILIMGVSAGILWAAGHRLFDPQPIEQVGWGLGLSVLSSALNGLLAWVMFRSAREHRSIALEADARHLVTDVWTSAGVLVGIAGAALTGYQIHTGRTEVQGVPFCTLADGTPEGCVQDNVFGTYLHGLFDTGELTEKLVALLCQRKGIAPDSAALIPMEQYRQQQFDLLADGVRGALDLDAVYAAMGLENPRRNAQ